MRQMFGNLSIHPKMVVLLAVPVAGTALLGATGSGSGCVTARAPRPLPCGSTGPAAVPGDRSD